MKNSIKILFIIAFSVISYLVVDNLKQMSSGSLEIPNQEQSKDKEIHSIDSPTILFDNLQRTLNIHVYTLKTKFVKSFYSINYIKKISKKKENKSVLAKNYFSYSIIPIRFKPTDIIFPFHDFW